MNDNSRMPTVLMSKRSSALTFLVLALLFTTGSFQELYNGHFTCPEKDVAAPCKCFTWEPSDNEMSDTEVEIACRSYELDETSLHSLFNRLNDHVFKTHGTTRFESLRIENTAIAEVKGEIFGAISFRNLDFFNNVDLTDFDLASFNQSATSLESLCVQGSPISGKSHDLLKSINNFVNLETLILANNQLEGLPNDTFNKAELTNLTYVDLSSNKITSLGRRSFYKLPSMHRLNLDNNFIRFIGNETFAVETEESKLLLIFLRYNQLTASSFEKGLFADAERTVFVYLNHNNITHLEEKIFRPIVESKSDLFFALWNNPFACDCRFKWLLEKPEYFKKRFHGVKCQDKRDIWDWEPKDLEKCL